MWSLGIEKSNLKSLIAAIKKFIDKNQKNWEADNLNEKILPIDRWKTYCRFFLNNVNVLIQFYL
jgi:hypothetical protein